ncbi:AbrB/MazE/SpoVT family DNA-binding domain-containing protein [Lyngbya confervoides]|uniref:AbrB/MazE/SpoVT family DNA-binding domain-containing protein n=1 Tax=Lyngbya confervoides BDU141951 TaxID=1574623 RepID=A0ABD4T1E2_9CYAN|nr:AbrB/MazE/SpoVT family DNA-binding domain-containing protein [Lyngbya confervoides]MCM1982415.1 AbrB/MazE/SpoVT family DNA-binding domain-containing protein [Lyngbya confervoides BDU141951]
MKSQVSKWGNSLAVRIPKHIVEALQLQANDAIAFTVEDGKAILEPIPALPELSLEELLEQVTDEPEPEVDWGEPVGQEDW